MTEKQIRVLAGIGPAVVYTAALLWFGATTIRVAPAAAAAPLAYVWPWLMLPGLSLLLGIGLVANGRFLDPSLIDGGAPAPGSRLDIDRRYLQNTLEQVVLALLGWSFLALQLPPRHLGVIPALAVSFVFARFCFWIGYRGSGTARAFGFAATFYPTVAAILWGLCLWLFERPTPA